MILETIAVEVPESQMRAIFTATTEWAKEFVRHVRQKWPRTQMEFLTNLDGDWNQIHWVLRFDSMAARDKWYADMGQDAGYKKLLDDLVQLENKHGGTPFLTHVTRSFYEIVDVG